MRLDTLEYELGCEFRRLLTASTAAMAREKRVGLLLSGGTDSMCVMWTLLELGIAVHAYTFHLEGNESKDCHAARRAAAIYGVELTDVVIPYQTPVELAGDVAPLVKRMGSARKTHVECTWPFIWMAPAVEERQVFTGMSADDLWGSAAYMIIRYSKTRELFSEHRRGIMADETTGGWSFVRDEFTRAGKNLMAPFRGHDVMEWFFQRSYEELNRPKQKNPALEGFSDYYKQADGIYRRQSNLQVGSGIREYMARMLEDPAVNPGGLYKWMRGDQGGLYGQWL